MGNNYEFSYNVNGLAYSNRRGFSYEPPYFGNYFSISPSYSHFSNFQSRMYYSYEIEKNARLIKIKMDKEKEERKRKEAEEKINNEIKSKIESKKNDIINEQKLNLKKKYKKEQKIFCENQKNIILESNEYQNTLNQTLNLNEVKSIKNILIEELYDDISKNEQKETNHIYKILLLGKTGVGKSTLINSIFKHHLTETGLLEPVTKFEIPEPFTYETWPFLKLYDSRGIEISEENDVEALLENINDFIEKNKENEENKIDCIWYCFTGTRLEKEEINFLEKLKNNYYGKFPFIMVYTQSKSDEDEKENENILKELMGENIIFIPVIAEDIILRKNHILKQFGLEELINVSKKEIEKNLEHLLFVKIMKKVENNIDEIKNKNYIEINKNEIEKIIKDNFQIKFEEIAKNGLKDFIDKKVNEIIKKIKDEESNIKKTYNKSGKNELNYNEIETNLKNDFLNLLKNTSSLSTKRFFKTKLFAKLSKDLKEDLNQYFDEEIKNFIELKKIK